jgi:hypothetical protein
VNNYTLRNLIYALIALELTRLVVGLIHITISLKALSKSNFKDSANICVKNMGILLLIWTRFFVGIGPEMSGPIV